MQNSTGIRSEILKLMSTREPPQGPMLAIPASELSTYIASLVVLCVFTVTGNSLVIRAYRTNYRLQTETFKFLVSLAVSDLLVGSVALPLWIYNCVSRWQVAVTGFYVVFVTLDVFSALASIYHLTMISIERYISITRPISHRRLTRKFYNRTIIALWIAAAVFALAYPFLVYFGTKEDEKRYSLIVFTSGFVLPLTLIMVMYGLIFRAVRTLGAQHTHRNAIRRKKSSKNRLMEQEHKESVSLVPLKENMREQDSVSRTHKTNSQSSQTNSSTDPYFASANLDVNASICTEFCSGFQDAKTMEPKRLISADREKRCFRREYKTAITLGLITGLFFVCWLPFFVVSMISFYCSNCISSHFNVAQLAMLVKWMHYSNSAVNPVVYSFRNPEIRKTFWDMAKVSFAKRKPSSSSQ